MVVVTFRLSLFAVFQPKNGVSRGAVGPVCGRCFFVSGAAAIWVMVIVVVVIVVIVAFAVVVTIVVTVVVTVVVRTVRDIDAVVVAFSGCAVLTTASLIRFLLFSAGSVFPLVLLILPLFLPVIAIVVTIIF